MRDKDTTTNEPADIDLLKRSLEAVRQYGSCAVMAMPQSFRTLSDEMLRRGSDSPIAFLEVHALEIVQSEADKLVRDHKVLMDEHLRILHDIHEAVARQDRFLLGYVRVQAYRLLRKYAFRKDKQESGHDQRHHT